MLFKILIVNDSPVLTSVITAIVETQPKLTVAGTAANGEMAIRLVQQLKPDLVLMDIHMPVMGGVEAIRCIKEIRAKTLILITTATVKRNMTYIFDGLQNGALDFVHSPRLMQRPGNKISNTELKIAGKRMLHKINVILDITKDYTISTQSHLTKHNFHRQINTTNNSNLVRTEKHIVHRRMMAPHTSHQEVGKKPQLQQCVAIGCSTGGPTTLSVLLSHIPRPINFPIIVCQHMDEHFTPEFAKWLKLQTRLPVEVARDRSEMHPGVVYVALGGKQNITVTSSGRLAYESPVPNQVHSPNIDHLFKSMASHLKEKACGVILTGLGNDGAKGLKAIKDAGGEAFIQNPYSSIVPSMPLEAQKAVKLSIAFELPHLANMISGWVQIDETVKRLPGKVQSS